MKRAWLASTLFLSLALVSATGYLLILPTPALAATGSADCGGGKIVSCTAYKCVCSDGSGCVASDANGNETMISCTAKTPGPPDNRPMADLEAE